jgi:hypothetical protein
VKRDDAFLFPSPPEELLVELLKIAQLPDTARADLTAAIDATDYYGDLIAIYGPGPAPRNVYERIVRATRELRAALQELERYGWRSRLIDLLSEAEAAAQEDARNRRGGRPREKASRHIAWIATRFLATHSPAIRPSYSPASDFVRFVELCFEAATGQRPKSLERYIREIIAADKTSRK